MTWLSHQTPAELHRAWSIGGVHVCARCLGVYPVLLMGLVYRGVTAPDEAAENGMHEIGSGISEESGAESGGLAEPPTEGGLEEPPTEDGGLSEPPQESGSLSEPPGAELFF